MTVTYTGCNSDSLWKHKSSRVRSLIVSPEARTVIYFEKERIIMYNIDEI